ncbi:hypothetical protein PRIPAC_79466 [Pristionchus pacificus]|uniref:SANTA domain-containing protein n=1 Tax=Pristionchus pacificus TaxID=54126 RepID=A0A2A6CBM2_PRIPA|nr:hypothetical protein PRIPAC_79466 [Pristionchus pacificus]|eukprot:PDM75507.1 hypothetical protein PRIPAC_42684 [Pristionchus pacificus]
MAPTPLYYWFPQIRHDGALIFGGSIDKGDGRAEQQTDAIVWTDKIVGVNKRKGALKVRYVIDNSFEEYQLRGDISKLRIGKLGIDSFFGGKFKRGLPRNWKKWVTDWKNYIEEERRQAQQRFGQPDGPPIPAGWRAIAVRVREIETERGVLATGFPFNVTPQEIKAFFSPLEVVSIHRSIAGAHLTGDVHITFSTTNNHLRTWPS